MTDSNMDAKIKTCTEGKGLELFLLHGWGVNSHAFAPLLPLLAKSFKVTTADLPGFGINHKSLPNPYTVDAICEQLASVVVKGAILAGWSLGGLIAQRFALLYPEKLTGLICIASSPYFMQDGGWPGMDKNVLQLFMTQLKADYRRTVERFIAIQAMGSETAKQDVKALKTLLAASPDPVPLALENGLYILQNVDIRHEIGRISCPTLRLYGKRDSLVPVTAVDYIHALHPQSDNVILPQAAHAPFISYPEQCASIIAQFAGSIAPKSEICA